ncbi:OmpA family protein [uncultured Photobacterium sp.]|uniref:OmpA family protein n=1 Tax=uncultured Photobacterium sp. TaxID=173973 RepID=UPI002610D7B6|nr:OmpA family protein [uncultured Photobacterium sp.]
MHKVKITILFLMSALMFGCSSNANTYGDNVSMKKVDAFLNDTYEQAQKFITTEDGTVKRVGDQVIVVLHGDKSFKHDSAEVRKESHYVLERLSSLLVEHPQSKIFIAGHTDSVGAELYNKQLSERRALSVSEFIVSQGVDSERLGTFGFGEMIPIAENDSAVGRRENRRIEVRITPKFELFVI